MKTLLQAFREYRKRKLRKYCLKEARKISGDYLSPGMEILITGAHHIHDWFEYGIVPIQKEETTQAEQTEKPVPSEIELRQWSIEQSRGYDCNETIEEARKVYDWVKSGKQS